MRQEMAGFCMQWHQLDDMQTICTLLQTDNNINTPSLDFLQAGCSSRAQWTVSKHTMHTMVSKSQTWGTRREGLRWRWKVSGLVQVRRDVQPRFLQFFQNHTLWLFTDVPWPSNSLTYTSFLWPAGIKSHISTWDTHLYTGSKHHTWTKLSTRVKNTGEMKLCYNIIQHFILFPRAHTCKIQ